MAEVGNNIQECILRSRNYRYRDVRLPHKAIVIIGRGSNTKIRERRCSKTQVEIVADYSLKIATIRQLGSNPSEINGELLHRSQTFEAVNGCSINLLANELKYTLDFISNKANTDEQCPSNSTAELSSSDSFKRVTDSDMSLNKKVKYSEGNTSNVNEIMELNRVSESLTKDLESLTTENTWEEYDHSKLLIYTPAGLKAKSKIAAFDMDNTIICTKSGKVFPVDSFDWKILYAEIPGKLKDMSAKGYKIILFTNQKGISKGHTHTPNFKKKIEAIVKKLGVAIQVFVSTGVGKYRKPNIGMWEYFSQQGNENVAIDMANSLYVGDAAGRIDKWAPKRKKDFSTADRLFALNVRLNFYTPEEFFLGQKKAPFTMPAFDPRNLTSCPLAIKLHPICDDTMIKECDLVSSSPEVIVFVGYPASGKSHFAQTYLISKGYVHICRDNLGTWQKCVGECLKALKSGKRVVIDNTNPDAESRSKYIECAQKMNVSCRCFLFSCSLDQARHNNRFRLLHDTDEKHKGVNDMILNSYKSKFKDPTLKEGFSEIVQINFIPKFKNVQDEMQYKLFLLEK